MQSLQGGQAQRAAPTHRWRKRIALGLLPLQRLRTHAQQPLPSFAPRVQLLLAHARPLA